MTNIKSKEFTWGIFDKAYYAYYGKEELGYIEYYKKWRKWVWNQGDDIIMSLSCLNEVIKKIKELEKNARSN